MIDYLVPEFFIDPPAGFSGGMHTKVKRVEEATRATYRIRVGSDLSKMRSDFLLIEPLYFRMEDNFDLDVLREHKATKILYCSEMELFRWTGGFRKAVLEICDAVTYNCYYQQNLFTALNIDYPYRLIDPIPENDFTPLPKRLSVASMGRISEIKGSGFIAELYKALAPTTMETVYVGGAELWGETTDAEKTLESEIRQHTDVFHQNILPEFVPKAIGAASFFVANTIHDVSALSHCEALMSGCISICGDHPIYAERPGFVEESVADVVSTLEKLTKGFQKLPDARLGQSAREWAVQNVSFDTFTSQLTTLLKSFY